MRKEGRRLGVGGKGTSNNQHPTSNIQGQVGMVVRGAWCVKRGGGGE